MFEPDFFDPAFQADEPQSTILRLLRGLADTWQPFQPATHAEEMAIGVLILTDAVQVDEGLIGPEARLTLDGERWQRCLDLSPDEPIKAGGAVLKFIWDRMPDRPGNTHEAPDPSTSGAEAPAADGPPHEAPKRTGEQPKILTDDDRAVALYSRWIKEGRSFTWKQFAKELGVARTQLYEPKRFPNLLALREAHARSLPSGRKQSGRVEADYHEDWEEIDEAIDSR